MRGRGVEENASLFLPARPSDLSLWDLGNGYTVFGIRKWNLEFAWDLLGIWNLGFGIWNLFVICDLGFGIWDLGFACDLGFVCDL